MEKINLVLKYFKVGIRDGFSEKPVGRGYFQSGSFRPTAVLPMHKRKADIQLELNAIWIDTYSPVSLFVNGQTGDMPENPQELIASQSSSEIIANMHRPTAGFAY